MSSPHKRQDHPDIDGRLSIEQAPFLLFRHFFTVAFYAIWVLFTHPRRVGEVDGKPVLARPRPDEYPFLAFKSLQVVSTRLVHCLRSPC